MCVFLHVGDGIVGDFLFFILSCFEVFLLLYLGLASLKCSSEFIKCEMSINKCFVLLMVLLVCESEAVGCFIKKAIGSHIRDMVFG